MARVLCVVLCVLVMGVSGCVTHSGGVASSSRPLEPDSYNPSHRVSGTSWGVHLFGFIPLTQPSTADALNEALSGSDGLIQITTDTARSYHLLLVVLERIKVEGTAVRLKPIVDN
jgi:hypothetical protein